MIHSGAISSRKSDLLCGLGDDGRQAVMAVVSCNLDSGLPFDTSCHLWAVLTLLWASFSPLLNEMVDLVSLYKAPAMSLSLEWYDLSKHSQNCSRALLCHISVLMSEARTLIS
jgi:hypothetical protein